MRVSFKWLLPVIQAVFSITLLLLWDNAPPKFMTAIGPVESDVYRYHGPGPKGVIDLREFSVDFRPNVETNLPAAPAVIPLFVALNGRTDPLETPQLLVGFGLAGIGIWFFIGRFADDALAARRQTLVPRMRILDVLFFIVVVALSLLVLAESDITSFALSLDQSAVRVASISWLIVGCTAVLCEAIWMRKGSIKPDPMRLNFHPHPH